MSPPIETANIGAYRLDRAIGQGTYGKVYLGFHKSTNEKVQHSMTQVAVKVIDKTQIQTTKNVARLQREIRFLKLLNHPHIVKVFDVVETDHYIYIVMEYAVGGELFDYIVSQKRVREVEARSFFRMVLSAVDYCHKNSIIHRDLKPENLLLDDKRTIKIIDFGLGNNFKVDELLDTFCGSPFYAAPEMVLGQKYEGPEVDVWSLGVILFALLCGHLPFDDENMKELYKKIASGSYTCPDHVAPSARHLISRLITVDPKQRATLSEVLLHPWVLQDYSTPPHSFVPERPVIKDPKLLSPDIVRRLQIFGYTIEEIDVAFSPNHDHSKPSPVRATYHLLKEMVDRQRLRQSQLNRLKAVDPATDETHSLPNLLKSVIIDDIKPANALEVEEMNDVICEPMNMVYLKDRRGSEQLLSAQARHPASIIAKKARDDQQNQSTIPTPSRRSSNFDFQLPRRTSTAGKIIESVSGWFLNYSTTSSKSPDEIIAQLLVVLKDFDVVHQQDTPSIFICDANHAKFVQTENKIEADAHADSSGSPSNSSDAWYKKKNADKMVRFQIEIGTVPRMSNLSAIHFKRLGGGVWNYRAICDRILSSMAL